MSGIIKEAIEHLAEMGKPNLLNVDGIDYTDKEVTPILYYPRASELELSTLTSLVEYIEANIDKMDKKMIIHVVSPKTVHLISPLNFERKRECLVKVSARVPQFEYERYIEHERFCIALQAKFLDDPESDWSKVLQFAGTVEDGTVAQYSDDGISQKATVKTGIASKGDAIVPNPVRLRPFRTFHEVAQPMSDFIFRMKSDRGVECALFEADGGAWENVAMQNIKEYLEFELKAFSQFTVIS